MTYKNFMLQ